MQAGGLSLFAPLQSGALGSHPLHAPASRNTPTTRYPNRAVRYGPRVWLTELLRFHVVDGVGSWRLVDVGLDLSSEDSAAVRTISISPGRFRRALVRPWSVVREIDVRHRRLIIEGADLPETTPPTPPAVTASNGPTPPRRFAPAADDVLDALVLDLVAGRATRISDLRLAVGSEETGQPTIAADAADVGPWGLVRRLTHGSISREPPADDLVPWRGLEYFRGDLAAAAVGEDEHRRVAVLPAGEIARMAAALPYPHVAELVASLPESVAADTLESMTPDRARQVVAEVPLARVGRLLDLMAPENATRVLAGFEAPGVARRLDAMSPDRRACVAELLRYPEGTVGSVMTNEVVRIPLGLTVGDARDRVRRSVARANFTHFLYVVTDDEASRLEGVLSLRDLVVADAERRVDDVMQRYLVTLHPLWSSLDGARRLLDTHLAALPVVGADRRLVGAMTVDAAIAVASQAGWQGNIVRVFS